MVQPPTDPVHPSLEAEALQKMTGRPWHEYEDDGGVYYMFAGRSGRKLENPDAALNALRQHFGTDGVSMGPRNMPRVTEAAAKKYLDGIAGKPASIPDISAHFTLVPDPPEILKLMTGHPWTDGKISSSKVLHLALPPGYELADPSGAKRALEELLKGQVLLQDRRPVAGEDRVIAYANALSDDQWPSLHDQFVTKAKSRGPTPPGR